MNRKGWSISDLIDLEYFLEQDDGEDLEVLASRDREIYNQITAANTDKPTSTAGSPQTLLSGWLAQRKKRFTEKNEEATMPGKVWEELFVLFFWGILVTGLISGGTLAFSFLSYSGAKPVNVSAYFGIFVVLQVFFLILLLLLSLYRRFLSKNLDSSIVYRILRGVFQKAMDVVRRRTRSHTSAAARLQWSARGSGFKKLQRRYGKLFIRPFFLLAQLFGVSFNVGVLGATFLKVIGSDVAFGWQTTLQVGSDTVHALVGLISLPWSLFMSTGSAPTLAQIEGSKLVLKDGIYHLTTLDLTSWWPFLCLSVLFYGLLPRLIVLLVGFNAQHRELKKLHFGHSRYRQIIHRMQTPQVLTRAAVEGQPDPDPELVEENKPVHETETIETVKADDGTAPIAAPIVAEESQVITVPCITAFVPDELFTDCPQDDLRKLVQSRLGYKLVSVLPVWSLDRSEEEELAVLNETMAADTSRDVLLLQEAWQPPIQELFTFLGLLRQSVGEEPTIIICLIGKPSADTIFTPVQEQNFSVWKQKLAKVGDSGLQLNRLV